MIGNGNESIVIRFRMGNKVEQKSMKYPPMFFEGQINLFFFPKKKKKENAREKGRKVSVI